MNKQNFMDVLKKGDEKELEKYIITEGKKNKPISPICFLKEVNDETGETANSSGDNGGD